MYSLLSYSLFVYIEWAYTSNVAVQFLGSVR